MIENRIILCFASGYDAPPTSKHHVMHLLAQRNVVLWVNYHASRTPTVSSSDLAYIRRKLKEVFAGLTNPRKNLYVLTPMVIPLPNRTWARKLNRLLLLTQLRAALRKLPSKPVQLWSFTPDISYLLGRFGEEKVVYYCVDDHAAFTGYDTAQVLRDEEDLCRRADLVVTTSQTLQEQKKPYNPNTLLVPHGVDYEHFATAVHSNPAEPADMANIPHPRLGFFGLIRDWVNVDLLAQIARQCPDWHFVLLGDSTVDLAPYRGLANMHFLGRKSYQELPGYCRYFDVGLIPFQVNQLTHAVNPIKLREYLAAGLPVVSTPMPEVMRYNHLIHIANTPETFIAALETCLTEDADGRERRCQAMAHETWPDKLEQITKALLRPATPVRKAKVS
ncbi:MAG: glycosyltransferase [Sedimentisphaerales bacterium]|nr:glycosyltransferase [Sedimentisphaerales bacterium]